MKTCQFCAEEIQDAAIVCKHCGRDLPPAPSGPEQPPLVSKPARSNARFLLLIAVGVLLTVWRPTVFFGFVAILVGLGSVLPGSAIIRWGGGFLISLLVTVFMVGLGSGLTGSPSLGGGQGATSFPSILPQPVVTMAEYGQLQNGMSYVEAVRVIGASGEELSRSDLAGIVTVMYSWTNPSGSNMNAMFQDGAMVQKAQFGLP